MLLLIATIVLKNHSFLLSPIALHPDSLQDMDPSCPQQFLPLLFTGLNFKIQKKEIHMSSDLKSKEIIIL